MKLDFAYIVESNLKCFQAVSLKTNLNQARYFGSRAPGIVQDIARKTGTVPFLTAVVDEDLNRNDNEIAFALRSMTDNAVRVLVAAEIPMIAREARLELRV